MSMIAKRRRRRTGGFTLIELLVVVSIIALLISILLPSLSRAREQAKLTVCSANMNGITKVLLTYLFDLNKIPLYAMRDANGNVLGWASWTYGGWSGRNREHWEGYFQGFANVQTSERPLTVYALKGGQIADQESLVPDDWPDANTWPTEEAPVYKCPSDTISAQWQWSQGPDSTQLSAYDDVGTSYQLNFSWWEQYYPSQCPPGTEDCFEYATDVLGPQLFLKQMTRHGSRFTAIFEDPCDYGLNAGLGLGGSGIQTMGFHGRFSKHVAAYLDGHAGYRLMDTRHLHDSKPNPPGPRHSDESVVGGWTACDEDLPHVSGGRHG
ncbi:MAG: prepilin-type N-terminal cleavage/methylation domain-containing protein [Planctomycetes bacterium]|nr:prepilin-type N-terminal cleavage/methylation domain-containing protein [Planctomycetota bacterium]